MKGTFDDARAGCCRKTIEIYGFVNGVWLDTFLPHGSLDGHLCNSAPARINYSMLPFSAMVQLTSDLWNIVVRFVERPAELQALAAVCLHLGALVRDRRCWGRALTPLFHFPRVWNAKELRMACDWMVIRQLPERWQDADQVLIAGSFALHEVMVRRGLSPSWYPEDIDVWLVNGSTLQDLANLVTERLRTLGLTIDATPGCGDYVTNDRFDKSWTNQDAKNELVSGSCVVMRVIDLRYSFDGIQLGRLSLIGTRPADPRVRGSPRRTSPPRLTAGKVMERFDIDVCRVGLLLPGGDAVFYDAAAFDQVLTTMNAKQKLKANASEREVLRELRRRSKYESRGFNFC